MKSAFIIAMVAVAMIGMMIPSVFAIHHQSSDTLPESFTVTETPNAPFQSYYQEVISKSSPSSPAPGFYEISQYAIGTVGIQIIFVESNGSVDPSKYDWTEPKMKIAEANIKKGLEFLEDRYPFEVGKLEFSYRPSMIGETGVEASTRVTDGLFEHEDYVELVEDTLTDTGCGSKTDPLATKGHWPGDEFRIHVLSCGNEVRDELNTDWATVIFVPYTATHVNGLAFGFTEGAFIQDSYMTTVNGGGVIPAHEWTHMVGATDMIECDFFGPEHEECGEKSGYLYMDETDTIPMTNCLLGNTGNYDSIPRVCISDGAKHQMGWVDENNNNMPDIIENNVLVNLSENQKQSDSSVIIEGTIMLEPVKCKWPQNSPSWWNNWSCKDTTINKIIEVTSIPNVGIESKDGEFDSAFEEFTITVDPLKFDNMEIEIQVKDKITNTIHSIPVELNITELEMTEDISNMSEPIVEPTPSGIASFVDQTKDPQHYIDRYNDELNYKEWFDENYSQYNSIYQAVGLEEQIVEQINEPEYVTEPVFTPEPVMEQEVNCGTGTESVNGICQVLQTEEKSSKDGGCLIATATYGSEIATEVQQLRELRDNQLLQTASGTAFMGTFNDIYYSFSPIVADYERENPLFKQAVKLAITPMISTLLLMENANSESEIISLGLSVIALNIGMYLGVPAVVIVGIRKRI